MKNPFPKDASSCQNNELEDDRGQALILAGKMADAAINLVGGRKMNVNVPPIIHIDNFSKLAGELRTIVEEYNSHMLKMTETKYN